MADRIVLHIGAPKAATTFLQSMWWHDRAELASAGIFLPGDVRLGHRRASQAIRDTNASDRARRTWKRMRREIRDATGTALISNEWISMASVERVRLAVEQLGEIAPVHVIFTARDPASSARAAWQEVLKLGRSVSLDQFLIDLAGTGGRWSWQTLDPAEVLPRWSASLAAEQIHVVTVPPRSAGPNALWDRVAEVLAVDPAVCDVGHGRSNPSLSVEGAALLQAIGPQLRAAIVTDDGHWLEPYRWIRHEVAETTLLTVPGHPIGLREHQLAELRDRSERTRTALRGSGYHVVGDLDELDVPEQDAEAVHPAEIDPSTLLELAGVLSGVLLSRLRDERERAEPAAVEVTEGATSTVDEPRRRFWRGKRRMRAS